MLRRLCPKIGRTACFVLAGALVLQACASGAPPPRSRTAPPVARKPEQRQPQRPTRPAWQLRRTVPDAVDVPSRREIVRAGEGVSQVARRTGSSVGAIAAANSLAPPYALRPGQMLIIPGGRYHAVKPGETGITIARAYGVKWSRVVALNRLSPPYLLEVGDRLLIPSAQSVAAMSVEDRAAAFQLDIDDLITGGEPAASPDRSAASGAPPPRPAPGAPLRRAASADPVQPLAGGFAWPLQGRLLSGFGPKANGLYNDGINIAATAGAPVRAAADGVVAYAGDGVAGFGGLILLKHGRDWVTAYAHAEELLVSRGQAVRRGDLIARAGSTGSVDEPQLHFEIRKGRAPVDPLGLLPGGPG